MRLKQIQDQLAQVEREKKELEEKFSSDVDQYRAQIEALQMEKAQFND